MADWLTDEDARVCRNSRRTWLVVDSRGDPRDPRKVVHCPSLRREREPPDLRPGTGY